jgi:hypothetical protein
MVLDTYCCFAESFMLGVANKPSLLSGILQNVIMLTVVMLSVAAPASAVVSSFLVKG